MRREDRRRLTRVHKEFWRSKEWKDLKKEFEERYGKYCQSCGKLTKKGLTIHHPNQIFEDPSMSIDEMAEMYVSVSQIREHGRWMCRSCHHLAHRHDNLDKLTNLLSFIDKELDNYERT